MSTKILTINLLLNELLPKSVLIERKKIGDSRKMCDVIEFDNDATVNVMALYEAR